MRAAMVTDAQLYRLLAWLSPAFPVGAFSYSHGLEWAVEEGLVRDRAGLEAWLVDVLEHGGGWSDAVLLARGHDTLMAGDDAAFERLRELADALLPTAELALESLSQGTAFAGIATAAWGAPAVSGPIAYPLAVAASCASTGIGRDAALLGYLHALAASLVSAGVRLVPLGQTDGQRVTAALAPVVSATARCAAMATTEKLATASLLVDWCSMRHQTQYTRLFRS